MHNYLKSLAIFLSLGVIIIFSGCGNTGNSNQYGSNGTSPAATPTPQPTPTPTASDSSENAMKTTPSGLQYQDLEIGVGPKPFLGQTLLVAYTGYNTKGIKFDSGTIDYRPGKDSMIKGFALGILGGQGIEPMREGGKRKIIVPPELGYGNATAGTIPPNSTLIFEIELLRVRNKTPGF